MSRPLTSLSIKSNASNPYRQSTPLSLLSSLHVHQLSIDVLHNTMNKTLKHLAYGSFFFFLMTEMTEEGWAKAGRAHTYTQSYLMAGQPGLWGCCEEPGGFPLCLALHIPPPHAQGLNAPCHPCTEIYVMWRILCSDEAVMKTIQRRRKSIAKEKTNFTCLFLELTSSELLSYGNWHLPS